MKFGKIFLGLLASSMLFASCGTDKKGEDDHFFQLRGIVLAWEDVVADPSIIDWLGTLKKYDMNTISIFGHDCQSPEYAELRQRCIDMGFGFEYENHGMTRLLPRNLFEDHPEYFRMNENGERVPDYNGCPSNPAALDVVYENVKVLGKEYHPSNHRYYFWLHDGGDKCYCEKCRNLNLADQALLFENAMIKGLREIDPEAMLAHLAYQKTSPAPTCVKPAEGIFLEYAPIDRCHEKPLLDLDAAWTERTEWKNGDFVQMLKDNIAVFGAGNAQILEYWLDDSLFSMWSKPQKPVRWSNEVFDADIEFYASLGIRNITCYGAWIDDNYKRTYGETSFIDYYCKTLRDYKPTNEVIPQ